MTTLGTNDTQRNLRSIIILFKTMVFLTDRQVIDCRCYGRNFFFRHTMNAFYGVFKRYLIAMPRYDEHAFHA